MYQDMQSLFEAALAMLWLHSATLCLTGVIGSMLQDEPCLQLLLLLLPGRNHRPCPGRCQDPACI